MRMSQFFPAFISHFLSSPKVHLETLHLAANTLEPERICIGTAYAYYFDAAITNNYLNPIDYFIMQQRNVRMLFLPT